ncbi:6-phosphogluconate dehydrogenase, decarboxylating [Desulfovibrio sp. X2]|uniref:phosphogluconate dehydrogenase (NAD(+)-dependent, decarboxylating) n=1 Tax=Desulfovibrio sp. X2 TaxID=941449 RepID=UPI000358C36D|nr:decarboxylating 6-phosphogluconate dehydrogenase [Desulfovibrio sp. X2]EPR44091.1 6-phosphogluconate dehydrogenase, decarboxylating [Desulfovibrio sp. X2]
MRIGMIGLGRMGLNMARRLLRNGIEVAAYNRSPEKTKELAADDGAVACFSLKELVEALPAPRVLWVMLPAGKVVDEHLDELFPLLSPKDLVIDGGNSWYKDDIRHASKAADLGLRYMDVGTSGGIWGLEKGYCLMAGGGEDSFALVEPALKVLAPKDGYMHCGPVGSGHFVKMVHNGIEYGMMQAYAEGFSIIERSPFGEGLDYSALSHLWNQGSVIRSWLLELAEQAFADDSRLTSIRGYVEDSGEGRWTVQQAVESGASAPVITLALMERFRSRDEDAFGDRVLAALRHAFGGHAVKHSGEGE